MVPDSARRPLTAACLPGAVAVLALAGCAVAPSHEMLNAVLWQQQSAEYRALSRQSYVLAAMRLDEALASPGWSAAPELPEASSAALPPAVVLDVDETVIDNARYEARIVTSSGEYSPESFADWCEEGAAAAVPGATAFLAYARQRGVSVFFYSSREARLRDCTRRTLDAVGAGPVRDDMLFLQGDGTKAEVRRRLVETHRIVLVLGDNLEDFVDGSKAGAQDRRALMERYAGWFGTRWIVLPNPTYGHWESLYYGFDHRRPHAEKIRAKRAALQP